MSYGPYRRSEARGGVNMQIVSIVALVSFLAISGQQGTWPFQSRTQPTPEPVLPTPDPQTEPDGQLGGSYLVVVEESQGRPIERIKILNDYDFWSSLHDRGLKGYRILDPDSPDSTSFIEAAAKREITPPFVMHVSSNGKVIDAIPFPNKIEKIEAILQ